jgi:hypothetical protein
VDKGLSALNRFSDIFIEEGDFSNVRTNCYLCGASEALTYCKLCQKYFCKACERRYPSRVIAATLEGVAKLKQRTQRAMSRPGIEDVEKAISDDESCCGRKYQRWRNR